jgi:hypothetical protein
MNRIVLHASRRSVYRKIVYGVAALATGAALLWMGIVDPLGWAMVGIGGAYAIVALRSLGEEAERIVIDDTGVRDTLLPVGIIGWNEIVGASVQRLGNVPVVALELRDPERVIRRLSPTRQMLARAAREAGLPGIYLTLVDTDGDPKLVAEAINKAVRR